MILWVLITMAPREIISLLFLLDRSKALEGVSNDYRYRYEQARHIYP